MGKSSNIDLENEAGDVGAICDRMQQDVGIWFRMILRLRKASTG
jgi:hypothetical protein